ncbi:MAG: hypothetical protein HYW26_05815 [Candidatus Aenigmarchaeota archaeon]|nr:hypothetical protein [Candidatus Aenigmarchaeota archaeon]
MKKILIFCILAIIFISGCTSNQQRQESAQKITTKESSELALQLSDFPIITTNWTLKERTERVKSELNNESLGLGWKKGYRVTYYRIGSLIDTTAIQQLISFYPLENITKTLNKSDDSFYGSWKKFSELTRKYNLTSSDNGYIQIDDLSDPGIGDESFAYRIVCNISSLPIEDCKGTHYYIEFRKLNVYEMLVMSGGTLDYELLKEMAKKAEEKIV